MGFLCTRTSMRVICMNKGINTLLEQFPNVCKFNKINDSATIAFCKVLSFIITVAVCYFFSLPRKRQCAVNGSDCLMSYEAWNIRIVTSNRSFLYHFIAMDYFHSISSMFIYPDTDRQSLIIIFSIGFYTFLQNLWNVENPYAEETGILIMNLTSNQSNIICSNNRALYLTIFR